MILPSPVVANNSHTELEVQLSELRKEVDEYKDIIELQDQVLRVRQINAKQNFIYYKYKTLIFFYLQKPTFYALHKGSFI